MNNDVMHSRVQLEPQILRNLVTEVKETVATNVTLPKTVRNSFGIVGLWNIRRNGKFARGYRKQPRIVTGLSY
jgi:hypothetical protein